MSPWWRRRRRQRPASSSSSSSANTEDSELRDTTSSFSYQTGCMSSWSCFMSPEEQSHIRRSIAIDRSISSERQRRRSEVKLLLLGSGESGKSTILKQMRLIHDKGFSRPDLENYRSIVFSNIIQSAKALCDALDLLGIPLGDPFLEPHKVFIQNYPPELTRAEFPPDLYESLSLIYQDPGIKQCLTLSHQFPLADSTSYYLESLSRIAMPGYLPDDQDVLRTRAKTTGITEAAFKVGDLTYRMFDVGGQRSERRKWIYCFENVTAIIFVVAISAYNQNLLEDETVNRMQEALSLFSSICNSEWFVRTSIILFLNKMDIFSQKIPHWPLKDYFEDYDGGKDVRKAATYLIQKFTSLNCSAETKQIYTHLTCATDTDKMRFVMAAIGDIILQANLRECGLL
ncbi:guanine nucleotide-binding protein subunit alpha, other [Fonticula alba]|uniref:Guanine nucleotide-binding protein subunit alpha, other n=1 Tax=Fonticula alba TaxID=691883 RepID=A0A058Z361_FONAL|nr:guanine nucleotide-binding protein subunit alpha, other [Fonticula alba]KCV68700.1 guanine nucleotide-binding protein subunit alpha, other [Fonticula alba]|eukprot:XP_009497132.1 guanine nucleotide-binding protein subunit alpha, other [Fonticula alba]